MSARHPRGVCSAAPTPPDADIAPDHAAFMRARRQLEQGCDGIARQLTMEEADALRAA